MTTPRLEGRPSDDQKQRLEDWLSELKMICRSYQLLLNTDEGDVFVVDLVSDTVVGLGLTYLVDDQGRITGYDCSGSILDGVWPVDTPSGPVEQRTMGPIWPRRPIDEMPT